MFAPISKKNVLSALGLIDAKKKYALPEIGDIFGRNVKTAWVTKEGVLQDSEQEDANLVYLNIRNNRVVRYAVPISGYGLWSTIYGVMALDADGETVVGVSFYQHGETPGLGGECSKPWFQNSFQGKKIVDRNGQFVSVGVLKGKVVDSVSVQSRDNFVDGMSGATITSLGINKFIHRDLLKYEGFSKRLRQLAKVNKGAVL